MNTYYCWSCGRIVKMENLGSMIPDDEYGKRVYCKDCRIKAIDDLYETKELV